MRQSCLSHFARGKFLSSVGFFPGQIEPAPDNENSEAEENRDEGQRSIFDSPEIGEDLMFLRELERLDNRLDLEERE